ncbi:hypothetical protein GCM10011506_15600 [Marivirga lumbricoides]|uniref:DinB-like domain-containing protein n=1 Tax=Marivirga lumbricoides TaxID=1046115 RepID=A0ABQ1LXY5_9BACT|nr:hypothetical protein GCM10011506_15600 [Marivirga lumbricoides]
MNLVHAPFYNKYVNTIKGSIHQVLEDQLTHVDKFLNTLTEDNLNYRYAEGKWTLKEVLLHCLDVERIMAVRALMISRGEQTNLPGFNENVYVENTRSQHISLNHIITDFRLVRESNLSFYSMLHETLHNLNGKMDNHTVSVASLWYIIAGHWNHHLTIIKERYLTEAKDQ